MTKQDIFSAAREAVPFEALRYINEAVFADASKSRAMIMR
jgi:hypothetical protein